MPFAPTDLANLEAWYKADAIAGPPADGALIASWPDSSGNGRSATNVVDATKPVYKTSIVNGLPVARFDGAATHLNASFTLGYPVTVFVVGKVAATTGNMRFTDGVVDNTLDVQQLTGTPSVWAIQANGTYLSTATSTDTSFHVHCGVFNGASSNDRVGGGAGTAGSTATTTSPDGVILGNSASGSGPLNGDVAEVIVYSRALSNTELDQVGNYLAARYGVTWLTVFPPISFYLKEAAASGSAHLSLQDGGSAPSAATSATGWVAGTVTATKYARMDSLTERASSALAATAEPSSGPDNTLGDCFRSENSYSGSFGADTWSFSIPVQGETRATSTTGGKLRIRVWRATDPTGSGATEMTSATQVTSSFTSLANSAAQTLTLSWTGPAVTLTGEYIFVQVAFELDVAGNNANADVHFRLGSTATVTTPGFAPTAAAAPATRRMMSGLGR